MAIKYFTKYRGDFCDKYGNDIIIELKHRENIPDGGVTPYPIPTRIKFVGHEQGPVVISYKPPEQFYKLSPINGSECTVNILADDDFDLSALYTSDEKEWQLVISGAWNWVGYVMPDSCSEPFEYKPYPVTISATDGLGLLKDIPYALEDGTLYTGFNSDRFVLKIALEKTGLSLDMSLGVNTYDFTMLNMERDPLSQAFIDQARFIDADGNPFSCEEVIRSICARYSSRLHQFNGRWQLVNGLELSRGQVTCYNYDSLGAYQNTTELANLITAGGLDRDIQPVGDIQLAKAFKKSTAYYQYGYIANQLFNGDMDIWSTKPNGLPDGWVEFNSPTVVSSTEVRQHLGLPTTDYFILFNDVGNGGVKNINEVQVRANEYTSITCDVYAPNASFGSSNRFSYISFVIQDDSGKYFANTGWQSGFGTYVIKKSKDDMVNQLSLTFKVSPQPFDYQITFGILAVGGIDPQEHYATRINNVYIKPNSDDDAKPAIGSYDKMESTANQSYKPEPIVLLHSDDRNEQRTSLINIGTADSGSNPTNWYRKDITEVKSLLQIVANTELRMHSRPYRILEATFYGYDEIDINTLLTVDLIAGKFMFLSGDFDLKTGNHNLRFAEVLINDVNYIETLAEDYGQIDDKNSVGSPAGVGNNQGSSYVDNGQFATSAQLAYFVDNINSPIPIKHMWFGTTAERDALTTIDPYTYYVLTDSLTPVIEKASNTETQAGTDDAKYITPLTLANWWSYIKGLAQTITGLWTFSAGARFNGSVGVNIAPVDALHVSGNTRTTGSYIISNAGTMFSPGTNMLAWTTQGIERMRLQTDGRLTVTTAPTGTTDVVRLQELNAFKGSDKVLSKSAAYTVLLADFGTSGQVTIYVTTTAGNVNITLPTAAVMNGYTVNVIKVSSDVNSVNVIGTINGVANDVLGQQYDAGTYKSNGTGIFVF